MKRGYTFARYLEKIHILREAIPSVAVTADMIVGFPGETEEDLSLTLQARADPVRSNLFLQVLLQAGPRPAICPARSPRK
jgi:tRNA A37 methylthiotransferase MiaB